MHFSAFSDEWLQTIVCERAFSTDRRQGGVPRCSNNETIWFWSFRITFSSEEKEEMVIFTLTSTAFKRHLELVTKPLHQSDVKYAMRSPHIHLFTSLKNNHPNASCSNKHKQKWKHADYCVFFIKENTGWPIKKKNYQPRKHLQLICFLKLLMNRINCQLVTSVSRSTCNQAFLSLKLQIAKWHTSYPAWWRSAWGQHSWNRKHQNSYDLSWKRMFLWLPPMFSRSHSVFYHSCQS